MSLISRLFTLPFGKAFQAYTLATWELKTVRKDDPRYAEIMQALPGAYLKTKMQPFLDKVGIRKDLIFVETPLVGFCCAVGTNRFKADAALLTAPKFYETDEDACNWTMKHEISHLKYDDGFTRWSVSAICQLTASIFGMYFLSFWPAWGLSFTVGNVSYSLLSQWQEARADDFAIKNSSDEELKGGRRFFITHQEAATELLYVSLPAVMINSLLDREHPSLTSRIQKIEKVLRARNIEIDETTERQKINRLKEYMANNGREAEQNIKQTEIFLALMSKIWSFF